MTNSNRHPMGWGALLVAVGLVGGGGEASAAIDGIRDATTPGQPTFDLVVRDGYIVTPDGGSVYTWGYANGDAGVMQYPGPTLIVNQGDVVTVRLRNDLDPAWAPAVSAEFPGQQVTASGGVAGLITREARPGEPRAVSYQFTVSQPGTYLYHSATSPELQVEMGLVGALIVRPVVGGVPRTDQAYADPASRFDEENLFLLSEMDDTIHQAVEQAAWDLSPAQLAAVDTTSFFPTYWFINGRCAPDTMTASFVEWLPNQPYSAMPMTAPGHQLLLRVIGGGRDLHPFHHHGNHSRIIARDGRPMQTPGATGLDLSYEVFTVQSVPGETVDALFSWTGRDLGWDAYGHTAGDGSSCSPADGYDRMTNEWCPDHLKEFPVQLPEQQALTSGPFYSGSPFLGVQGDLPPGQGTFNEGGGYVYMWHSHTEKEMTNFDIFPGGMMTMLVVAPHHHMMAP